MATPADIAIIKELRDCGPLSSLYLRKLTESYASNMYGRVKRLKLLRDLGYIQRIEDPRMNDPRAPDRFRMYEITERGLDLVGRNKFAVPTTGDYPHMAMTAAIIGSIKSGAGVRFGSQEKILREAPNPTLRLQSTIPTLYIGKDGNPHNGFLSVIPDQLFEIQYETGRRIYAVEADRGTHTQATINEKIEVYADIIRKRIAERQWGVPNIFVIFITTDDDGDRTREKNAVQHVPADVAARYLFHSLPGFQRKKLRMPPPLFPFLWGSYNRPTTPFDISQP